MLYPLLFTGGKFADIKICERVAEAQQFGFISRKGAQVWRSRRVRKGETELDCVILDLERAPEKVPSDKLCCCMGKLGRKVCEGGSAPLCSVFTFDNVKFLN